MREFFVAEMLDFSREEVSLAAGLKAIGLGTEPGIDRTLARALWLLSECGAIDFDDVVDEQSLEHALVSAIGAVEQPCAVRDAGLAALVLLGCRNGAQRFASVRETLSTAARGTAAFTSIARQFVFMASPAEITCAWLEAIDARVSSMTPADLFCGTTFSGDAEAIEEARRALDQEAKDFVGAFARRSSEPVRPTGVDVDAAPPSTPRRRGRPPGDRARTQRALERIERDSEQCLGTFPEDIRAAARGSSSPSAIVNDIRRDLKVEIRHTRNHPDSRLRRPGYYSPRALPAM